MGEPVPVREQYIQQYDVHAALREVLPFFDGGGGEHFVPEGLPHIGHEYPDQAFVIDNKDTGHIYAPQYLRRAAEARSSASMVVRSRAAKSCPAGDAAACSRSELALRRLSRCNMPAPFLRLCA